MKITLKPQNRFVKHDEQFRQRILDTYKMPFPHHVVLTFPPALVTKMERVRQVSQELHLTTVHFGISIKDSVERPVTELYNEDNSRITIPQYEEGGMRDTVSEFSLTYEWFFDAFEAEIIMATGYCDEAFSTKRFKLEHLQAS